MLTAGLFVPSLQRDTDRNTTKCDTPLEAQRFDSGRGTRYRVNRGHLSSVTQGLCLSSPGKVPNARIQHPVPWFRCVHRHADGRLTQVYDHLMEDTATGDR